MEFTGKRALITGGSRGIGLAVAKALADQGAKTSLVYRENHQAAKKAVDSLAGGPHSIIQADVGDPLSAGSIVEEAVDKLGGLDILVNNAGIAETHLIDEHDFQEWLNSWKDTMAVNLFGPAHLIYFAARQMIKAGGGSIVNVSSRGAFRGEPEMPAYAASKAGLNAMSQSLAQRLARHNISVGVVAPGFVETDMTASFLEGPGGDVIRKQSPFGRVAKPEEVAAAVIFLCRENTRFLSGAIIDVNGASYLRS